MVSRLVSDTEAHGFTHVLAAVRQIKGYMFVKGALNVIWMAAGVKCRRICIALSSKELPLQNLGFICSNFYYMIGSLFFSYLRRQFRLEHKVIWFELMLRGVHS